MIDERKMSKEPPPAPTAGAVSPCPTMIPISRTPRHWKFTQHHRTTRPPPVSSGWNVPTSHSKIECLIFKKKKVPIKPLDLLRQTFTVATKTNAHGSDGSTQRSFVKTFNTTLQHDLFSSAPVSFAGPDLICST